MLDLIQANLLSPPVLCFALGALAVLLRSDVRLPEAVFAALSAYLMLAIGLKGGAEIARAPLGDLLAPTLGAVLLGCAIPLWCYTLLRRFGGLSVPDAAAIAAHYGSVSAVTFAAVTALLDSQKISYEGFAPALLAVMEVPAIVIAIGLARVAEAVPAHAVTAGGAVLLGGAPRPARSPILAEVLASKSILLLAGGVVIGALATPESLAKAKPFFGDLFQGALCLFLLHLGFVAASRVAEFRQVGPFLVGFALTMPVLHGLLGVLVASATGLSEGGAVILGTLAASASYIAAPAAVRLALPEANPGLYLTSSLALTFPFNVALGIPLYQAMARAIYG